MFQEELSENGISVMLLKPARKVLERNKSNKVTGYLLHVLNAKNFGRSYNTPILKKDSTLGQFYNI